MVHDPQRVPGRGIRNLYLVHFQGRKIDVDRLEFGGFR